MSDWNTRRFRPRTSYEPNYSRFHHQQSDEIEQQSPLPLLVPSFNPHYQHHNSSSKSNRLTEKHLPHRLWFNTSYQEYFRQDHQHYFKFHLVCYNILAQLLLEDHPFLYMNCLKTNLKWYRRRDRLLREFLRQDADILCLQEMEIDHYENDFRPKLLEYGYESIYQKRSGNKSDGCCLFYKTNRLKLIQSKTIPFYQKDIPILDRDNCGLIALFQPLTRNASSEDLFCVATTHLLFSPKRGDIKLAQVQYFLAEIDRLAIKDPSTNSSYPIILCGDFNAQPQSPLIQFLLSGYIKYDNYRCIDISSQIPSSVSNHQFSYQLPSNELLPSLFVTRDCRFPTEFIPPTGINHHSLSILTHNKQFHSVYDLNNSFDVTSNGGDEPNLVDYIFYSQQTNDCDRLNHLSRLDLYQQNQMFDIHIPNHQFPSDHFLLAAKFALKLRKKN